MNVLGAYTNNGNNEINRLKCVIDGFARLGYNVVDVMEFREFRHYDNIDYVIVSGTNKPSNIELLSKYKTVIWVDQCRFHKFPKEYKRRFTDIYHLFVEDHFDIKTPIYKNDLPSDRCDLFNINPIESNYLNNDTVLLSHRYQGCAKGNNEKEQFHENSIKYMINNNIKFKMCFHPGVFREDVMELKIKEKYIEKYSKYGNIDYEYSTWDILDTAKCVLNWQGRISVECIIKGVPIWCGNNTFTKHILNDMTFESFLDRPYVPSIQRRQEWLNWLSYTNWSVDELKSGEPQKFLLDMWGI